MLIDSIRFCGNRMMNEKETKEAFDEPIMIRVSRYLVDKCKAKLKLHEATPAYIVVDTALREYLEAKA